MNNVEKKTNEMIDNVSGMMEGPVDKPDDYS